jgi:hypothetical protein
MQSFIGSPSRSNESDVLEKQHRGEVCDSDLFERHQSSW